MREIRFVGLDVHKDSIAIALADDDGQAPEDVATVPHDVPSLIRRLKKLGGAGKVQCCYEAGPTGFGLCRALNDAGLECVVVAPSLVPRQPGDHVKTDRRDARKLARFLRSGDLVPIHVPDATTEAIRDLERAREDAKRSQISARHQLRSFLLRQGRRFPGKTAWTRAHLDWIRQQQFDHEAHNQVLFDAVHAVDEASRRVERLDKSIAEMVQTWTLAPLVRSLQALRGVQLLTAVVLAAELGDFSRFATASKFMAYVGLVPSEHSSGDRTQRWRITRAGNTRVRRVLVESSWHYRHRPSVTKKLRLRCEGIDPRVTSIAWSAQLRLCGRYRKLLGRGKSKQQTVVAVARELAGFVWSIARQAHPAAA